MTKVWVLVHTDFMKSDLRGVFSTFQKALDAAESRDEIIGPLLMDCVADKCNIECKVYVTFLNRESEKGEP